MSHLRGSTKCLTSAALEINPQENLAALEVAVEAGVTSRNAAKREPCLPFTPKPGAPHCPPGKQVAPITHAGAGRAGHTYLRLQFLK